MKSKAKRIRQLSIGFLAIFGLTWVLIYSCEKEPVQPTKPYYNSKHLSTPQEIRIVSEIGKIGQDSDPIKIKNMDLRGDFLYLQVEYPGGCNDHKFQLVGDKKLEKSLPPIRSIQLVHTANKDNCRALLRTNLLIDLRPLAASPEKGSEIYFNLAGFERYIYYQYSGE